MTMTTVQTTPERAGPMESTCDSAAFRALMSQWPTGVTVVTTADGATPVGCTVNAMMSVSLSPALLVVALATGSHTLAAIRRHGRFALNLLTADQQHLCRQFATGEQSERFAGVRHRWHEDVPLLVDVGTTTVCHVRELIACGDHVLVVGAPLWHRAGEQAQPLVFYRRTYRDLAHLDGGQGPQ